MSFTLTDAYKEALLYVPNDNPILETLSFEHIDEDPIYIVKDYQNFTAYLEDLTTEVTFIAGFFDLKMPAKNNSGVPDLSLAVGNADGSTLALLEAVKLSGEPLEAVYRVYLYDDPSTPAVLPVLRLQVKNVRVTRFQAAARAVFARDLKNTRVPKERYTRARFPGLG